MTDEELLCQVCRHPKRRHTAYGCTANAGACECAEAPEDTQAPMPPVLVKPPAPKPPPRELPPLDGDRASSMLATAERSGVAALAKQAEKVREAVRTLEDLVTGYEERAAAEKAVADARRELAEAETRLRKLGGTTKAAAQGQRSEELRRIREWAARNDIPCADRGSIPRSVMGAYEAAHRRGVAA